MGSRDDNRAWYYYAYVGIPIINFKPVYKIPLTPEMGQAIVDAATAASMSDDDFIGQFSSIEDMLEAIKPFMPVKG